MKKIFLFAILIGIAASNAFAQSPRLLKKELKESISYFQEKDGYTLKYYMYTYLSNGDTLFAAYNINGKRITPLSKRVHYCGAGIFCIYKDNIAVGYNTNGTIVFPATLKTKSIQHKGGGMMVLWFKNENSPKKETYALYSSKGKCIIPEALEYDDILYYYKGDHNYIVCIYINPHLTRTYTADGQWFQEGSYSGWKERYELNSTASVGSPEFEFFKRPASEATKRYPIDQSKQIAAYKSKMKSEDQPQRNIDLMEILDGTSESSGNNNSNNSTNNNSQNRPQHNTNNSSYNNRYNNYQNNNPQPVYVTCPACGGSGRDQGRIQWYTNGGTRYCATCGTSGLAHDHIYGQCGRCGGTGRVQQ